MPTRKLAGARTSSIQPSAAGRPRSVAPKHAYRAAASHAGGADGNGMNAKAHHSKVETVHTATARAGTYPTFQRNERIFQFAK
jgi:hypothetical protein